ncbi:MAG: hypothetical protein ACREKB_16560 [Candidatus Rokuibacteriota bacterium]
MMDGSEFEPLADIEVEHVSPEAQGLTLTGQGQDRAEYRLALHFDMPLDARTRAVLGELLAQSELRISRRAPVAPRSATAPVRRRGERTPRG